MARGQGAAGRRGVAALAALALALCPLTAAAQPLVGDTILTPQGEGPRDFDPAAFLDPALQSVVLTVDTDRLFADSAFGRRKAQELLQATEALASENRRIEAELLAEEQSLTRRRPSMPIAEFRAAAEDFDSRVQAFRLAQDSKEVALQGSLTDGRDAFLQAAAPLLGELMQQAGASVILDRRTVFLALGQVDITDEAIAAIDSVIGDGRAEEAAHAAGREAQQQTRPPATPRP